MTALEAKRQLEIERKILVLIGKLPDDAAKYQRVSFQIMRISDLQGFIIAKAVEAGSPLSEAEEAPAEEPISGAV